MAKQFTDDQVRRARERFARGETCISIARDVGTNPETIRQWCRGLTHKDAGGPVTLSRVQAWELFERRRVDHDLVRELHHKGWTGVDIAAWVDCSPSHVSRLVLHYPRIKP